ncbi:TlpA disulfide reductase family protein [Dinghuibacter silviterrae]|uniref:Peroxiredoxin n=1 Tax=Dinghuibacter silviterrae TaxID=1539049 RepID=A0A4R8DRV2_9BACT|nr:TlpA disulfide reductase family protein [Dinghuibacter silviterrae]TDX00954.1 peroxiredoxin [Dinghuibacter silviterrae]
MQNKWLIPCLLLWAAPAAAQTGDTTFTLQGTVPGTPDGAVVYLFNPNISRDTLAKDIVHGGHFTLRGPLKDPNLYFLAETGSNQHRLLFLDPAPMSFTSKDAGFDNAVVQGSVSEADYLQFEPQFAPYFGRLGQLAQRVNEEPRGSAASDSLIAIYRQKLDTLDDMTATYVKAHPASHVSTFILAVHMQVRQQYDWLETQYALLQPKIQQDYYGRILEHQIVKARIGKEGTMAIDFTQNDVNGNPVTLSSFRGKFVLVDFWASWCGPCRMENPNVVRAYQEFKGKNFTILSVSLDQAKEAWVKAITDDGLTWTQVSDLKYWNNAAAQLYNISSIPQNMLVDPKGRIIARNLRGEELEVKLKEVLQ